MPILTLDLQTPTQSYVYGEPLLLRLSAKNPGAQDVFLVRDRVYATCETPTTIRVLLGVAPPTTEYHYCEFQAPTLERVAAGQSVTLPLQVGMPPEEPFIGSLGIVESREVPISGAVDVYVAAGVGKSLFVPRTLDPLGEFLRWQTLESSNRIRIQVAAP